MKASLPQLCGEKEVLLFVKPMSKQLGNYAFIDAQNLNLGVQGLGWKLDFVKFRRYLKERYAVTIAYFFIGYVPANERLYLSLQKKGYVMIFKPVIPVENGEVKGNIDADLVLQAMIDYNKYDKAVIVSSDGDFYSLVKYLYFNNKLRVVISPYVGRCSSLLKKSAREKILFLDVLKAKLEYRNLEMKKHL